jgi:hypothetical protein
MKKNVVKILVLASFFSIQTAHSKTLRLGEIWLAGLGFLESEGQRNQYLQVRSELLKDPSLAENAYRSLIESEVDRKNRADLMTLIYEINGVLCVQKTTRHCHDFLSLWKSGLSDLLFFESSPQKLHKSSELLSAENCREAASVLSDVERVEGRCIPVLEALIKLKECQKEELTIDPLKKEIEELRSLIRAI